MGLKIPPALHQRRFALFWIGIVFTWAGNEIFLKALPWHIRTFTDQPFAFGIIGLIRVIPVIGLSLFAGIGADLFNRRKVVMVTQGMIGLIAVSLGVLTFRGMTELWHIYALLGLYAIVLTFDLPARYSLTPNLVPAQILPNAISVEMIGFQIGSMTGPVISGFLIEQFGQHAAYLTGAVLITTMPLVLLLMGPVKQEKLTSATPKAHWASIKDGARYTFRHALIYPSMLLDFLATLLIRADSLMPIFAYDILGVGATAYGWLAAAPMIGAAMAGFTLSQVREIRHQGRLLLGSVVMIGVGAIIFGTSRSYLLSLAALILVGASDSVSSIIRSAIRQMHTPDRLRGRMMSVNQIFFMGGPYLGDLKSGLLGSLIGVPLAVALGGGACILMVGWINQRWPKLRAYNGYKA